MSSPEVVLTFSTPTIVCLKNSLKNDQQGTVNSTGYEDLREKQHLGRFNYIEQTFRNGNSGIYSAGTHMKTPLEFNLTTELEHDKPAENMIEFIVCRAHNSIGI